MASLTMVVQPNPNRASVVAIPEDKNCGARMARTRTATQTNDGSSDGYSKDATIKKEMLASGDEKGKENYGSQQ